MSPKNNTKVLIGGNVYTLSGNESEEYIQRIALYLNKKMDSLKESNNGQLMNTRLLNVLLAINIADDFFKERDQNESYMQKDMVNTELMDSLKSQVAEAEKDRITLEHKINALEIDIKSYKKELDDYIEVFDQSK